MAPRRLLQPGIDPPHQCDKNEQLDRIEGKLDVFLERVTAVEGRVVAHEYVAGALLAVGGLVLGFYALK